MAPTPAHRIALAIGEHLQRRPRAISGVELPAAIWSKCQTLNRQLEMARTRDWNLAACRLEQDLRSQLQMLSGQLSKLGESLCCVRQDVASAHDIYKDIVSLESEFEDVTWSRLQGTFSVTTDEIVLDGIALGRFQIELDWRELPAAYFRVIALDPNPAASNDNVTHPHVEAESLCAGDARLPIQRALEQGRIADFFLIVNSVLLTYNSGSPYVSLADWTGVTCSDCGDSVDADDRYTCEKCEHSLCESCYRFCEACSSNFCGDCVMRCESCDEDVCQHCQCTCKSCRDTFCPRCVEENLCDNCQQEATPPKEDSAAPENVPRTNGTQAEATLHTHGVEQVAVLS